MSQKNNLHKLIMHAEALETSAREARKLVVTHIRREDSELATLLSELLANDFEQGDWLFSNLFRRDGRPIDLYASGRAAEVRVILGKLLHGSIL